MRQLHEAWKDVFDWQLQETPAKVGVMPGVRDVKFELSREAGSGVPSRVLLDASAL